MSNQPAAKPARNRLLIAYYSEGHSYRDCGEKFGITGSRVQHILLKAQRRAGDEIIIRGAWGQKWRDRFRAWDQAKEQSGMSAPQQRGGIGADVPEEVLPGTQDQPTQAPDVPHGTRDAAPPERKPEPDPLMVPPWAQQAVDRIAHAEQRLAQMEGWSAQASQSFNVLAARIDVIRKQQDINSQRALALDFAIKAAPTQPKGKPIVDTAREFLAFLAEGNPQMVEPVADGVDHGAEAQTTH